MYLSRLFLIHSIITFLAGLVLIFYPNATPDAVGIQIENSGYLICSFLGSAEIAIACLSFRSIYVVDKKALRINVETMITFHLLTAIVEVVAIFRGASYLILVNVATRILAFCLFYYYGIKNLNKNEIDDI